MKSLRQLRRLLGVVVGMCSLVLISSGVGGAVPIQGVEVAGGEPPVAPPAGVIERGTCGVFINFDEAEQPCVFMATTALRDEYLGLGVAFSHNVERYGGARLDECSNFGVSGYSSPNFFAINCGAELADGGVPEGPATMNFSAAVSAVSVLVGSAGGQGNQLTMEAYDVNSQLIDSDAVTLAPEMQLLSVAAPGIRRVVVGVQGPCQWVLDDLCFDAGATPVQPSTWGAVKSTFK